MANTFKNIRRKYKKKKLMAEKAKQAKGYGGEAVDSHQAKLSRRRKKAARKALITAGAAAAAVLLVFF